MLKAARHDFGEVYDMAKGKQVRAAVYLRVSRSDQNEQLQADGISLLTSQRGWVVVETFTDHGISGSKDKRPALDRMMALARSGGFDVLVCWKADRLFRSLKHLVVTIDELAALGVGFVSATEPMDTTTPQGKLLLHLVSAFAEFERGVLIERTRAGLDAAKRRGKRLGRPKVFVDVAKAVTLREAGRSYEAIGKTLGVSTGTIHKALRQATSGVQQTPPSETSANP
jgi:DNA invertase Pin-like site-specific DNA recombinase